MFLNKLFLSCWTIWTTCVVWVVVDSIEDEKNKVLEQYLNDDTFYISSDRLYQGNNDDDEFAGMYGPVKSVAGL